MPGMFRWLKQLVTKEQSKTIKSKKKNAETGNVLQQNVDSSSAIEELCSGGVGSSQSTMDIVDIGQADPSTSELVDDFSTLHLTNGQTDENAEKSDESDESDPLNCVQNHAIEIEPQAENGVPSDSDDSDDDSFYANLFADSKPQLTYVSAPTDTFPWDDDSESELDISHTVTFFIDDDQKPMCEYNDTEYEIGHLDLTTEEVSYLKRISEASIDLEFNPSNIVVRHNRLCVQRIVEQQKPSSSNNASNLWFAVLNLVRIQFSVNEPFLAKYENEIWFVGRKLHEEYMQLLIRTNKNTGTAIRLCKSRIDVNKQSRTLDVVESVQFDEQSEVCVISGQKATPNKNSCSQFRRYVINSNPCQVLEVDLALLHSSEHDDCMEIYAEKDFPSIGLRSNQYESMANADENELDDDESNFEYDAPLDMLTLKSYAVPDDIKAIGKNRHLPITELNEIFSKLFQKEKLRTKLKDYINGYSTMIHLEEDEQARYLATFNQTNVKITYHMDRQFYFDVPNPEFEGAIEENVVDRFILKPKLETNVKVKGRAKAKSEIWGQVLRVKNSKIYIEIFPETFNKVQHSYDGQLYDIIFTVNRMPFQLQHFALEFIEKEHLFTRLIHNFQYKKDDLAPLNGEQSAEKPILEREGTMLSQLNAEQQSAVENIICKTDKLPFILFGPPGTGKTRTLVAAIEQIMRTTDQKVLVCAMSNAACDEIAERLINVLAEDQMYRFYAKSYKNEKINGNVARNSNYSREGIFYPSLKYLYKFRVFICTLASAGCLTRARIEDVWRPNHFGYVFIDECASAHETMCLIPIAGLCTSSKKIHAKIVLAGDPKQLDAVTKSEKAKALGYSTSWLEQLCCTNLYTRNATTGKFNEMYITQLVKNYRSHPHILSVPNELFYENKLEACAAEKNINWYIDSRFLPSKKFPVVFKSVKGSCVKSTEFSWYNDQEIEEVIKVIKQLLPKGSQQKGLRKITQTDIGIVTPYRKQRHRLAQKLRYLNFDEVTVGTAEVFQGKEKPVMIISTVRSNGQLGFVGEPRRLNVVITRAKCLVVIIGDPHTLKLDPNWLRVMEFCLKNNSFFQSDKVFSLK
ncbi:putative helicase mov-10-B.1 isoform X2 [Sitodiplosis mosellana]|uniref:putative helicase mov-10-B.1 isoform X2 n=1 Tax=Sitodiplosis mosellana TaxID=263140 RepID=UPI00244466E1|nr:putative helicase mov-10-B.1 isoform X2 [Sitodiplosis mosellana]